MDSFAHIFVNTKYLAKVRERERDHVTQMSQHESAQHSLYLPSPGQANDYKSIASKRILELGICKLSLTIYQHSLTLVTTLMVAQPHVQIYKRGANQAQRNN